MVAGSIISTVTSMSWASSKMQLPEARDGLPVVAAVMMAAPAFALRTVFVCGQSVLRNTSIPQPRTVKPPVNTLDVYPRRNA